MPARPVQSSQHQPHPRLEELVLRHLKAPWRAPLHRPSERAMLGLFETCGGYLRQPWILDSGCGTGASTRLMAEAFPDHVVLGIDQSAARLRRGGASVFPYIDGRVLLLRAELATAWRILVAHELHPQRHYLLYPNPWPKASQLRRRWHGHPVFPLLLRLGGALEMRCNWQIYAEEFHQALQIAGKEGGNLESLADSESAVSSPFEQKYRQSRMPLWRVRIQL